MHQGVNTQIMKVMKMHQGVNSLIMKVFARRELPLAYK